MREPSFAFPCEVTAKAPFSRRSELDFWRLTRDWFGPLKLSDACRLIEVIVVRSVRDCSRRHLNCHRVAPWRFFRAHPPQSRCEIHTTVKEKIRVPVGLSHLPRLSMRQRRAPEDACFFIPSRPAVGLKTAQISIQHLLRPSWPTCVMASTQKAARLGEEYVPRHIRVTF